MKRLTLIMFILLALVCIACNLFNKDNVSQRQKQLEDRSCALLAAEQSGDAVLATSFFTSDATIHVPWRKVIKGRNSIKGFYKGLFANKEVKSFTSCTMLLEMARGEDMAYECGINKLIINAENEELVDMGKYLIVWVYKNDQWYVAALSFSSDCPKPVEMPLIAE